MSSDPTSPPPPPEPFEKWVHDALNHLYDTTYLQGHPLTRLAVADSGSPLQRSQDLRRVLLESIEGLRPAGGVPARSPDWRAYRILELRYIEGLSPDQTMARLGLARSQYFREQKRVLDALTSGLWDRWGRDYREAPAAPEVEASAMEQLARTEARRLAERASWEEIEISRLLDELRPVVESLARAKGARLRMQPTEGLRLPQGDRVMVRQAILSAVTHAVDAAPGGELSIGLRDAAGERGILLRVEDVSRAAPAARNLQTSSEALEVCRQLMDSLGGEVRCLEIDPHAAEIVLAWHIDAPRTLLAVDDNEGLIDLFRRFLSGHGWQVVGAPSVGEARRLLAEARPNAIALDVMMPGEDGWDLLTWLKADPATRGIPVIVCSVLRQAELARSLGAAAFLAKPVSQQDLLGALALWR